MHPQIIEMRVNGVTNPIGYDTQSLSFSWIVEGTEAKKQKNARLVISTNENCDLNQPQLIIHDSGLTNISSIDYNPNLDPNLLQPRTRYFWKVFVDTDLDEHIESPISYFETSKLTEPWTAHFISTSEIGKDIPPYVRKDFELHPTKNIKSARVYSTGFGLYELYINNEKATNEYFMPFYTNYKLWTQYQTIDITKQLIPHSKNSIGCILSDGWARGRFGLETSSADMKRRTKKRGRPVDFATNQYELLAEVHILYDDGTEEVVNTDKTWKCSRNPIVLSNIYDGEIFDANLIQKDWCAPNHSIDNWSQCIEIDEPLQEKLSPRFSLPVIVKERLPIKAILHTPKKETVIDVGQNITGWLEFKVNAPEDFQVILEFGEILQNGNFYRTNLRSALQQYRYISDGQERIIHPHFTYYGFRYVKLTKWSGPVEESNFTACNVYSDLPIIGNLTTSNPLVNQLISNGLWSQKDNFLDVPTDCPQRDERLGWTGDAQIFCKTAMFNMNCYSFYRKYLKELYLHQIRDGGVPPVFVPFFGERGSFFLTEDGIIAWADCATIMPFNVYLMNGKKQILEDQYQSMIDWVDQMTTHIGDNGLWDLSYLQLCDWLALDGPNTRQNANRVFGGTECTFCCTVFYFISLQLVCKVCKILNKDSEYEKYNQLKEKTLKVIRDEYFTQTGRCVIQTQTALSLALIHDLSPEGTQKTTADNLHKLLSDTQFHLQTGFIGTPILCRALTKSGLNQDAYKTFLQETYPGWLYPVTMGATSMWERWDSLLPDGRVSPEGMNSFNHYAAASVLEWVYSDVCGLNPVEEFPGFQKVLLKPNPHPDLQYAQASHLSPMGKFESGWKFEMKSIIYTFTVPFNAEAKVVIPNTKKADVEQSDVELEQQGDDLVGYVQSGKYTIRYVYTNPEYSLPHKFI